MYPRFIQLIIQNQLGVETSLFEGMLVAGEIQEQGDAEEQVLDYIDVAAAQGADTVIEGEALDACATLDRHVEHLKHDKMAQALEITKLKRRVKQLERGNKGRIKDVLMVDKENEKKTEESMGAGDDQSKDKGKGIMVEEPKPMKKKQHVEIDEEYARKLHEELNKDID
nr:hypothetical protein [Tanacetum cinerariifolium]